LTTSGFAVRTTTSIPQFDALVESWKPHLVLMDVMMPGLSGDMLCRRLKERFRATLPVVLVSDLPHDVLAERAKIAKADAFIAKTADFSALVDFVRNICAMTYSPEDLP
jgi:DNA-binding response OmpR family regulator